MQYVTLLKFDLEGKQELRSVFQLLLGAHGTLIEKNDYWQILHDESLNEAIMQTIQSLEGDFNCLITSYQDINQPEILKMIEPIFLSSPYGYYHFKSLILCCSLISTARELLDYLLAGTGVTREIIEAMADCDLNVSKAASILYMHRNTLLYKIDRMYELKHLDLRCFNDLYLLIKLSKA